MSPRKRISELTISQRHLPHWNEPGAMYHTVFTLADSSVCNLTDQAFATIVISALNFGEGKRYYLYDHTVMPDHVHAIIQPFETDGTCESIGAICGDIKRFTAKKINVELARTGKLWLDESYDRIIRDEREYRRLAQYIFENPLRASLIENPEDWPWWCPSKR